MKLGSTTSLLKRKNNQNSGLRRVDLKAEIEKKRPHLEKKKVLFYQDKASSHTSAVAMIAVELRKLEVKFDKPIYVSMCILDISKVCLYEFHYEYMYETMKRDIARFDTSDYPADNAYGTPLTNKKVPCLMKDENNGALMTEFVGLRAKMYAVRVDGKKDTKKVKGVKSNVVARTITFDDYTRCLNEEIEMTRRQSCIRSKLHEVYTISEWKIALSPYDDKRYIIPDSTKTLPWGHWRILL
ncbi:hypothetical protein ALC57_08291 [Trachymyrmex cornetzi]|uniref:Uncharacterized protein n=1 Tax=Trachymyrmex cornetzi TaxID=471704 RepID=A0A151J739_9HYME|nr:hypothetical protein ALC57_08291 [Trachymyrmex cornetzi]